MSIDYTLWPNSDTELGKNKVAIPDGINTTWPEGDALVGNFVYKNGLLSGFVDTKALTVNESKSTVINYDYFDIELPFTEGEIAITRGSRSKYFNVRYSVSNDDNVVITLKYKGCKTLDDVRTVDRNYRTNDIVNDVWSEGLGDLEIGYYIEMVGSWEEYIGMFYGCRDLESFTSDLSSLTDGTGMFQGCTSLTTFIADLPKLTIGIDMFHMNNFTTFTADLPSLTYGAGMFYGCNNLTSFSSDLSNLTMGYRMFENCSNLTTFSSDLPSLTDGERMFEGCKLDTASVQHIAYNINTVSSGTIHIGIGNSSPNSTEIGSFNEMVDRGWTVYVNGSEYTKKPMPPLYTDENGEETVTPIPYWAKPVPSDEEHAQYVDEQGNFYNILGGNFIYGDNLETYGMFTCEEDAAANMRLTPYVKPQTEIENQ